MLYTRDIHPQLGYLLNSHNLELIQCLCSLACLVRQGAASNRQQCRTGYSPDSLNSK